MGRVNKLAIDRAGLMKRVMIYGGSGSGKSWLTQKLGYITGLPVVHIDSMYWKPNWVQREADETHALVLTAIAEDSWVFDGNHHKTFPERIARADHMIFLDFPTYTRLWRVFFRTIRCWGKPRPDMGAGCPERFGGEFFSVWIAGYYKRSHTRDVEIITSAPGSVKCYHLPSRRQVREFLEEMAADYAQT